MTLDRARVRKLFCLVLLYYCTYITTNTYIFPPVLCPLFSLALCSWMTVFGFYLRLEDKARKRRKRMKAARSVHESSDPVYFDRYEELHSFQGH